MRILTTVTVFCCFMSACAKLNDEGCNRPDGRYLHVDVELNRYITGAEININCKTDTAPPIKVTCQANGYWSRNLNCPSPKPSCQSPPSSKTLGYSPSRKSSYKIGSRIRYSCIRGYVLVGEAYRTCQVNGQFEPKPPICKPVKSYCPPPKIPQGGSISRRKNKYYQGDRITFLCHGNHLYLEGDADAKCEKDGTFGPERFCAPVVCKPPKNPDGWGTYTPHKEIYRYGESITYTCPHGKKLSTSTTTARCEKGGFYPRTPSCVDITCRSPAVGEGVGYYPKYNKYFMDDQVKFRCKPHYEPVFGDAILTCNERGFFDRVPLQCRRITKPTTQPEQKREPTRQATTTKPTTTAPPRTTTRPSPSPTEPTTVHPRSDGTCNVPVVANGYIRHSTNPPFGLGDTVTIYCYIGKEIKQYGGRKKEVKCSQNGQFLSFSPSNIECIDPAETARLLDTNTIVGRSLTVSASLTPTSVDKGDCPNFIDNGKVLSASNTINSGERVKIICDDGYKASGRSYVYCTRRGIFYPKTTCKEIPTAACAMPSNPNLIVTQENDLYKYKCREGYEIEGTEISMCYESKIMPEPPTCKRETGCQTPYLGSDLKIRSKKGNIPRIFKKNSYIEVYCVDRDAKLMGSAYLICYGTEWSSKRPTCQKQRTRSCRNRCNEKANQSKQKEVCRCDVMCLAEAPHTCCKDMLDECTDKWKWDEFLGR